MRPRILHMIFGNLICLSLVVNAIQREDNGRRSANEKYLLDLPHCKIPFVPLLNDAVMPDWNLEFGKKTCRKDSSISSLSDDGELTLLVNDNEASDCCYMEIMRPKRMEEDSYILSNCTPFPPSKKVSIPTMEFLIVKCGRKPPKLKFHSQIPKRKVQKKVEHWKNSGKDVPFSIMFLVLDAVQRSHAARSLPKTISFMEEELGFIDFKGHHSLGQSTFSNLVPMMLGVPTDEIPGKKDSDRAGKYDGIPFIWKNFSRAGYVTLHNEDNPNYHTFNFNGRTGFVKQPMDFYLRSYYLAQKKLNKAKSVQSMRVWHWLINFNFDAFMCVEDKLIYEYILDYAKKFLEIFNPREIPSFTINWLVWPHHDYFSALKTMDEPILHFMKGLSDDVLDNTIIIFVGDHGFKWANYSDTKEGLSERNSALLKIRVPDKFKTLYPNMVKNLERNAKSRVTSHIDLFKTLSELHRLAVNESMGGKYGYDKAYGYSLFEEIPLNRTCKDAQIPFKFCGCNFPLYVERFDYAKYRKPH